VVDFSKTFPEGYSKKVNEKRWRTLKKGFAEAPDTGKLGIRRENNQKPPSKLSAIAFVHFLCLSLFSPFLFR
jgi:hypothetical protein